MLASNPAAIVDNPHSPGLARQVERNPNLGRAKVIGILHELDETVKGVDIGAFGAARRAPQRAKHYPVGIVEAIDRLFDESARKSDVEWVLDVAGRWIVTPDHVGCAGCELLYFRLHRFTFSHAAHLPHFAAEASAKFLRGDSLGLSNLP
jgi:hypothetical protein